MSFLLVSCGKVTVFDASGDIFYRNYVGKQYEILVDMKTLFVKPSPGFGYYGNYEIWVHTGIQGRKIVQLGILEKGSIIKVTKINKYEEYMPFWADVEFYVTVNNKRFLGKEFYIVGNSDAYVKSHDKNHEVLNPKYFKEIQ